MSEFHLTGGGNAHFDRRICIDDLDQAILTNDPLRAGAFIRRWGEELREYLINHDRGAGQHHIVTKAA
jgi:hypothetical protein